MKNFTGATLCVLFIGAGVAGCGSTNILGGDTVADQAAPAAPQTQLKQQSVGAIALAPIIGPPSQVAQQLRNDVTQASVNHRITILPDRDPNANFGMRGYIVAAREQGAIKVSYIWDVTDKAGKRINRIQGEEMASAAAGSSSPWAAMTPSVTQAIGGKVAAQLATWLPTQNVSAPVASARSMGSNASAAGARTASTTTNATTSSLQTNLPSFPVVSGAPGDGNQALANALNRELSKQGVRLGQTTHPYRVEGQVALGPVKDGKQTIRIDWRVKDAKGSSVGTVTQKNAIPPGSLDQQWGQTADAAAAAAAQGIIKLLPKAG
ncbi:MAG: hypothetical protein ACK5JT_01770 [Hyphomicrobiaceae bacterium]